MNNSSVGLKITCPNCEGLNIRKLKQVYEEGSVNLNKNLSPPSPPSYENENFSFSIGITALLVLIVSIYFFRISGLFVAIIILFLSIILGAFFVPFVQGVFFKKITEKTESYNAHLKYNYEKKLLDWERTLVCMRCGGDFIINERENYENSFIKFQKRLNDIFTKHQDILLRKYKQSIYKDDYGEEVFDKWNYEKDYFILNIVDENIVEFLSRKYIDEYIDARIRDLFEDFLEKDIGDFDIESITPEEFEKYCALVLEKAGWETRLTKKTGDQGVDIVGIKNGICVVFQCKKYSSPVGNKAVQEVLAGRIYENAQVAAVITNNTYTKSARELAYSSDVYLLHYDDLSSFNPKI